MVNIVFAIQGVDQNPVLQELSDYGGTNIVVPREMSEQILFRIVTELLQRSRLRSTSTIIAAARGGETRFFQISEICYIESCGNRFCIVTRREVFEVYGSLRQVGKSFEGLGFIRVHGSFLISLRHVRSYSASCVEMDDGTTISIGRRFQQPFREAVRKLPVIHI